MAIDRNDDRFNGGGGRGGNFPPRRRFGASGRGGGDYDGSLIGLVPPQNLEAEMAVLGAMLLGDRNSIEKATEILQREDFYRDAHAHIYDAMVALTEKDEPVDIVTLKDELSRLNLLDSVGGLNYLMSLGDFVPTTANTVYYANIVAEKSTLRRLIEASSQISGMAYGDVDEIDVLVDKAERTIFEVARKRSKASFKHLRPLLNESFEKIDEFYHSKGGVIGIDTGLVDLNAITSGLQRGDLIIVAARPSMGKTALCLTIGQNAALKGSIVAVFSLEMGSDQLVQRMMCSEARIDAHKLRTGYLSEEDWSNLAIALEKMWDAQLFIDDSSDVSILEMRAKCRRLASEHGQIDLVIVDYLQLMRGQSRNSENRNQEISEIARRLKSLARELQVPVIALSQLSRNVERREDKRPMLSDLRESGAIEAEADVVAFIYRPAYYERKEAYSDEEEKKKFIESERGSYFGEDAELIIAKQRNGPTGTVKLAFLPQFARFDNLEAGREDPGF